jgi:small conductance mechanosensitive channel
VEEEIRLFFTEALPAFLPRLIVAVLLAFIGMWMAKRIARSVGNALERGRAEAGLASFVKSCLRITLQVFTVFGVLVVLGVQIGSIITLISAGAVAVGLALRDSMSNIASGIIILFTKPFLVGDFIEIGGVSGTVTDIQIMSTRLTAADHKKVVVPNSKMTTGSIINYSSESTRRLDLLFSIGYDSDISLAKQTVLDCAKESGLVLEDPAPECHVSAHANSAIVLEALLWCEAENYRPAMFYMNEKVKEAFDEAGIDIPYEHLTIEMEQKS